MKTFAYLLLLVLLAFIVLEEANAEASNDQQPQSDQPRKKGQYFRTWNVRDKKNLLSLPFRILKFSWDLESKAFFFAAASKFFSWRWEKFHILLWCVFHSDCVEKSIKKYVIVIAFSFGEKGYFDVKAFS